MVRAAENLKRSNYGNQPYGWTDWPGRLVLVARMAACAGLSVRESLKKPMVLCYKGKGLCCVWDGLDRRSGMMSEEILNRR